jgi:3-oxoacyl-[acyl-carrier protein] reductase
MESICRLEMLHDKICFITGSTRGIGWATARLFAQQGASVILNGRSDAALLDRRVEELKSEFQTDCMGILADAADLTAVRGCYPAIFNRFKRLDVLVNNAGVLNDALLGMIPEEMARTTFDINTLGPIFHLQEASRLMARKRSGSIINLTSIIGRFGNQGQTVYAASKAAIIGATLATAKELAPKNIRVNAVAPGFIDTDMTKQLTPDKHTALVQSIKMGRVGTPEDVARTILFFASDLSSYVTGQVLGVDGGMLV